MSLSRWVLIAQIFVISFSVLTLLGGGVGGWALVKHMFIKIESFHWELTLIIPAATGGFILGGLAPAILSAISLAAHSSLSDMLDNENEAALKALAKEKVQSKYEELSAMSNNGLLSLYRRIKDELQYRQ
jgi:hypothetical protein